MLTNECWLGYHDHCEDPFDSCDCLCHADGKEMFKELMDYLMEEQ